MISNIHPLLATVAAFILLKESLNRYDIIAVFGAWGGVFLMNISKTDSDKINISSELVTLGVILCCITTFLGAGITLTIRLMNKHIHYIMNPSWFAITLFVMSFLLVIFYPDIYNFNYYTPIDIMWFGVSGALHFIAQTVTSIAYKHEEATKIAPLSYTTGIILFMFDVVLFSYEFSITDIAGLLIATVCLMIPVLYKLKMMRSNSRQ